MLAVEKALCSNIIVFALRNFLVRNEKLLIEFDSGDLVLLSKVRI